MNIYKIVLSHGEPVYATEQQVDQIMNYKGQLVKIKDYHENKNHFFYVNKAFIVAMYYDHKIEKQDYELVDDVYKLKKAITLTLLFCAFLFLPMQSYAFTVTLHRIVSSPLVKTSEGHNLDTKARTPTKEKTSSSTKNTALAGTLPQKPLTVTELICSVFKENCDVALAIAKAESGLICDAIGDHSLDPKSYGLFQIRAFWNRPPPEKLLDCYENIKYAHEMFTYSGWQPWSAYTSGAYLKHL